MRNIAWWVIPAALWGCGVTAVNEDEDLVADDTDSTVAPDTDDVGSVDSDTDVDVDPTADLDLDGVVAADDCDDLDAARFPGNPEVCDGIDNDCDGQIAVSERDLTGDGTPDCDVSTCAADGLTFARSANDEDLGTVHLGCWAGEGCDAYDGDTSCSELRPVLCLLPGDAPDPGAVGNWIGASVALSEPLAGCQMVAKEGVDAFCEARFGAGWRMAAFHDGGWSFSALGRIDTDERFWVGIGDQYANCWNRDEDDDGYKTGEDCDDGAPEVNPGAAEVCNGVDDDCDGETSLAEQDLTGDGVIDCLVGTCEGSSMSWVQSARDVDAGTVSVTCFGSPSCDAYDGDATCASAMPVLCARPDSSPNPGALPNWFGGEVAVTAPVDGCQLDAATTADTLCEGWFGPGWRMARFHDGGGWSMSAYGAFDTEDRFRVAISDQTANCWD